ncbi:MAG: phosphoenolpyruvate kinase [Gammaproteobacteria bacterium]|nr:phosphoenolpyruvate kinase [Gammaproteobacteria bacterium]MBT4494790.1 phosphoenolpyruvate kinase [Gammaproteobacteria bacterium]
METRLTDADLAPVLASLSAANADFTRRYPGIKLDRLPIHTLYGGAHLFKKETPAKLGSLASRHLSNYAPDFAAFARALELPGCGDLPVDAAAIDRLADELENEPNISDAWIARAVYDRVTLKLDHEAIEDQRLDFEDGYGARADEEEDGHAVQAAMELAAGASEGLLPPFIGIRVKSLTEETKARSIRTLDLFLSTYAEQGIALPQPFYVTLPKVTSPSQVDALVTCVELLENRCGFATGSVSIELMIETIQSIINPAGDIGIPALIDAGRGRVTSAILGTFDYTATCNIASHYQDHRHPSADFARQMMQVCLTGTSVNICDGITNIMPIPPHKGDDLTDTQRDENDRVVHEAWRIHFNNILHSLRLGFYQSWDLNPAQLPIRYAGFYYFFLQGLEDARARLRTFIDQAAQASMVGNTFDDAASAQGLLNFFVNGINCGALKEVEALETGITLEELHGRSFQQIVENRMNT